MKKIKLKFEDQSRNWNIWENKSEIERSIQRVKGILPEMECAKQLTEILKKYYKNGDKVLDFGCAAGHFYYSLKKINKNISYYGFDATKPYIKFAEQHFKNNKNANFDLQNIFSLSRKYYNKFDIVFCSNVLLHLPSIDLALKNLLLSSKKYCIIRTLVSDNTHLSKFYHTDKTKKNILDSFQFQNTYSYNLIRRKIRKIGNYQVKFIEDKFDGSKINKEFKRYNKKYPGLTKFVQNIQISGSKVFEWKWIVIKK